MSEETTQDQAQENTQAAQPRRLDWYRTPIEKEKLKELTERSDIKGFLQAGGHLALYAATAAISTYAFFKGYWGLFIIALLAHGTLCSFMTNAVHELSHRSVFKTKKLNEIFGTIFGFLSFENIQFFWVSHSIHHKYTTNKPEDGEIVLPLYFPVKMFTGSFFAPKAIYAYFKTAALFSFGNYEFDWAKEIVPKAPAKQQAAVKNMARLIFFGHIGILVVSILLALWQPAFLLIPLLTTFAPFYGTPLMLLCNQTQHIGLRDGVQDFRLNCRSMKLNPLLQFVYWHMNYHVEHHMYAAVPCYNLGKLHKEIKDDLPKPCNGIFDAWFEIIGILWRKKYEPDYEFTVALPEGPRTGAPDKR